MPLFVQDIQIYWSWHCCTKGSRDWPWNLLSYERERRVCLSINTHISGESAEGIGM